MPVAAGCVVCVTLCKNDGPQSQSAKARIHDGCRDEVSPIYFSFWAKARYSKIPTPLVPMDLSPAFLSLQSDAWLMLPSVPVDHADRSCQRAPYRHSAMTSEAYED